MRSRTEENSDDAQKAPCPLCGTEMVPRRRTALSRVRGFLLAYVAAFLALWLLPDLDAGVGWSLALLFGWGAYMMRTAERPWCPECWFLPQE